MKYEFAKECKGKGTQVRVFIEVPEHPITEHGEFRVNWKFDVYQNEISTDGYFNGQVKKDGILYIYATNVPGIGRWDGVKLPADVIASLENDRKEALTLWEQGGDKIVSDLIAGKRLISIGICGCDFPRYQPWIKLDNSAEHYSAQNLMERAIRHMYKADGIEDVYPSNPCQFLSKIFDDHPRQAEKLPSYARVLPNEKEDEKYYGYTDGTVYRWEAKLSDILSPAIAKRKKEQEERQKNNEEEFIVCGTEIPRKIFRLLHSLAAIIDKGEIRLYTTPYATLIKGTTTYDIRTILDEEGFSWDAKEKEWVIKDTHENKEKLFAILKKHDTKVMPSSLGMRKCLACGEWKFESQLDADSYCGC